MVKFILPLYQQASIYDLLETTSASNIHQVPGGVLFAINFDLVCIKHGTGHPGDQPFLVSEERSQLLLTITRLTQKIRTTLVDTRAIRAYKT